MPAAAGNSYGSTTVSCFFDNLPRESSCRLNTTRMPAGLLPNFIMQQACSRPCMCSSWWAGRLLAYLQ